MTKLAQFPKILFLKDWIHKGLIRIYKKDKKKIIKILSIVQLITNICNNNSIKLKNRIKRGLLIVLFQSILIMITIRNKIKLANSELSSISCMHQPLYLKIIIQSIISKKIKITISIYPQISLKILKDYLKKILKTFYQSKIRSRKPSHNKKVNLRIKVSHLQK